MTDSTLYSPESMRPRPLAVASAVTLPPLGVIALNRMGFGPRKGDLDAFEALGATDAERLTAYVEQQLDPDSIDDSATDDLIAANGYSTLDKSRKQLWNQHVIGNESSSEPSRELERVTFLRAIYSERQLVETLADFWHNHFNVYRNGDWVRSMIVNYDRAVIRKYMLGNFRSMLGALARSASMLRYLDNYTNSASGPNENFARELLELHTLGAKNYLGVLEQNEVPTDSEGRPVGYVDADVFEATRALTGWTVAYSDYYVGGNDGTFTYHAPWHDHFQKTVLGHFMPANQGDMDDGEQVLDALVEHPGTASHIAEKLCRRLISDNPPASIVDAAATVFHDNINAGNQLERVVRTILLSNEFATTWGEKVKRPFEIAVSALRAADTSWVPRPDDSETDGFLYYFRRCGQELFSWPTPDGYPDVREAWQSSTPRVMSWRLVNWMMTWDDHNDKYFVDVVKKTPASRKNSRQIADYWIQRLLGRDVDAAVRTELIDFMAQGLNPELDLPIDTSSSIRERIRALVGLILMTPDFLYR